VSLGEVLQPTYRYSLFSVGIREDNRTGRIVLLLTPAPETPILLQQHRKYRHDQRWFGCSHDREKNLVSADKTTRGMRVHRDRQHHIAFCRTWQ
jgi:hypothetical protein